MARRHYRPEEMIAKLREAEILLAQGMKVPEMVKELGVHKVLRDRDQKGSLELGGL